MASRAGGRYGRRIVDGLEQRLAAWGARPTGETWSTATSELAGGVRDGLPVILKVAHAEEERRGGALMAWWSQHGGLAVLEHDATAVLMARATGPRDLLRLSAAGRDEEAEDVLVDTAIALQALPIPPASLGLVPLAVWFRDLTDRPQPDPLLEAAASIARDLLAEPADPVALHGDLHHGNVLDAGDRWAAIDPKGLVGHRAFDLGNVFCNPTAEVAVARARPRLERIAQRAALPEPLLAAWVVAWCGLSLTWGGGWGARSVARQLLPLAR